MHVQACSTTQQRISVVAIHNSDISDGWEREGELRGLFQVFSEARAYPLRHQPIFYLMTH